MKYITIFVFPVLIYLGFIPTNTTAQTAHLLKGFSLNKPVPESAFDTKSIDSVQSHFAIKTNPLLFASELMNIQVELMVHKKGNVVIQFGYRNSGILATMFDDPSRKTNYNNTLTGTMEQVEYSCKGFQTGIGYKRLFKNDWFLHPTIFYKQYYYIFASPGHWDSAELLVTGGETETPERDSFTKCVYGTTFLAGKNLSHKHLSIDFYGGIGYRFKNRKIASYNDWGPNYTSLDENRVQEKQTISLHLGLIIGYSL